MIRNQSTLRRQPLIELSIRQFLVWSLMLGMCLQALSPVLVLAAETRRSPKPTSKKQEAKPGATIVGIEPGRVTQGQAVTVTVRGKKTKWAKGKTQVSLGNEISVGGAPAGMPGPAQVVSKKLMQLQIQVEGKASLGTRSMRIVTGNDVQEVETALTVVPTQLPGTVSATVSTLAGMAGEASFADGETSEARFNRPTGMAVGPDEAIYVADTGNHRIRRVDAFGRVTTVAGSGTPGFADGTGTEAQFNEPQGVTVDAGGYVYVADTNNHRIRKIDPFGAVTTIAGTGVAGLKDGPANEAQFDRPVGMALDPGGHLYVADAGNESIRRIGLDGVVTTVAGNGVGENPVQLKGLAGIVVERETVLVYLADQGRILRLDAEGNLLTVAGSGRGFSDGTGTEARFAEPAGLALDATGTLIIADTANSLIREVLPEAAVRGDSLAVTTLAGTGERGKTDGPGQTAQFSQPRGVAVISSSAIIVADSGNHVVRKLVRPPVVEDFTPDLAAQTETIKLKGRQFDGRGPGYNAVDFARETGGRTPATVTAATATELTVVVPDDAATGKVRVQTGGGVGESRREFQLGVPAGPIVMDFRPRFGPAGTLVTVTGKALRAGNEIPLVTFLGTNGSRLPGRVMAATPGEVQVVVPDGAQTGVIEVVSAGAMGRSRDVFQVDGFGYRLVGVPNTAFVLDGSETAYVIHVNAGGELFQSLVELKLKEVPQGVTATFDRKWITAGATATLKVAMAKGKVLPGSYKLTVEGEAAVGGGMVRREVELTLQVKPLLRTALTGRVLSTEMEPIPGATVSLDGRSATTDGAGMFLLEGIEAGQNRPVMVDGRTATAPNRTYPVIVEPATVIFNRANTVPYTFFLPAIDTQYEVPVAPGQETVVTTPRVPGLKLTIPAEANLRNRDGSPVTRVSLTPVAIDRTPAPLPAGINLTMVFTAQPGGADSDVAMPVSFPNLTSELPGTSFSLWNFNHDNAQWEVYGTGHVSPDGRTIEPDINPSTGKPFGLPYFSWGGPGTNLANDSSGPGPGGPFPGGPGDPANCPSCSSDNPVNFATGFKVETETDFGWGGARGGLSLTRTHLNTQAVGRFGLGWSDNWTMTVSDSRDGFAASISVSGQNRPWLFSLARTEEIEGAVEPVKVYQNTQQAGMLGDELKYYPERIQNGTNEPAFWEYRSKGGTKLRFNQTGRWETMSDRNGNTTVLSYDERGRLVKVTDPVGRWMEFTYRPAGRTTGTENQVIAVTDVMQRRWEYQYGPDQGDALNPDFNAFLLLSVTDPLGHTMRYEYIALARVFGAVRDGGRLKQVIDKRGNIVKDIEYESGGTGRVISQKFADGGVERYRYTVAGGQVTGVTITDPMGRVTSRRFNTAGYVIETTDELGQVRQVERIIENNLPTKIIGANGIIKVQNTYDNRGNITEMIRAEGVSFKFTFDEQFNYLTSLSNESGKATYYTYDDFGNKTKERNLLGEITQYSYDQSGQKISTVDPSGKTNKIEYDRWGNISARVDKLGRRTVYEYNILGWLIAETNVIGLRTESAYNSNGQIEKLKTAFGEDQYSYDENGNLIRILDSEGFLTIREYDSKNRLITQIDPSGRITRATYNFKNEKKSEIDPSGNSIQYDYDERGLLIEELHSQNETIKQVYDLEQRPIRITDQRGNSVYYIYDTLGQLLEKRNAKGQSVKYEYDKAGELIGIIDPVGQKTTFDSDEMGRTVRINYPDAIVTFLYNSDGEKIRITDTQGGTILRNYNDDGQLIKEITPTGVITYTYTPVGQIETQTVEGESPIKYTYDSSGRIQTIEQEVEKFTLIYDNKSRLASLNRPNGITTKYEYDNLNRVTTICHVDSQNQKIEELHYSYNLNGQISNETSLFTPIQLSREKNIETADPTNQIHQSGTEIIAYNDLGQMISKADLEGITKFQWDARGRLTKVILPNGHEVNYSYDVNGKKINRNVNGITTSFLYSNDDLVQEINNSTKVNYLSVTTDRSHMLKQRSVDGNFYFIQDILGSTIAITDSKGSVVERQSYSEFGENRNASNITNYGYSGLELDKLTRLIYCQSRWYDPTQGRFLSEDQVVGITSDNLYTYVRNNPINNTDIIGEWPTSEVKLPTLDRTSKVHQIAIRRAAPSPIPNEYVTILADNQEVADTDQDEKQAYKHAMVGGNEPKVKAKRRANNYIENQILLARNQLSYNPHVALIDLAFAVHTLQDSTSPAHWGFQTWRTSYQELTGFLSGKDHLEKENFIPFPGGSLDQATRDGILFLYCDTELPRDYFIYKIDRR